MNTSLLSTPIFYLKRDLLSLWLPYSFARLPLNNSYPEPFSPPSFLLAQIAVGKYVVWLKNYNDNNNKKSSHQLNNMSNVWVKNTLQWRWEAAALFQHSQESCTLPDTLDGYGGLLWGHATSRISPSQGGFHISESKAWISTTTHKPYLRYEVFLSPHQSHLGVVSTIPRNFQARQNLSDYATCSQPAKPGSDGNTA